MLDLDEIFKKVLSHKKIEFDFFSSVFLMAMDRLSSPHSKLQTYLKQERYAGVNSCELHHLYRALDVLCGKKEEIELRLFEKQKDLFSMELDIVFYDVIPNELIYCR